MNGEYRIIVRVERDNIWKTTYHEGHSVDASSLLWLRVNKQKCASSSTGTFGTVFGLTFSVLPGYLIELGCQLLVGKLFTVKVTPNWGIVSN